MRLLSEDDWEYLFSKRNEVYEYKDFITAIAKFPYVCNDKGPGKSYLTDDEMCA